ncbi:hypothetical protein K435DRAFT_806090 [Dendrothele bispora CBS 962.96]|uniref:C2H2-type domain-containing protein n=1 Tax=Dendrothele bispora (strain CBS 962.96) TaxID=1314807 RepID=A0A4S8L8X3_DENBC|nr:hypothetical protein K435DRAFT_806090 [Dendrothele bispora CBS 962.96]
MSESPLRNTNFYEMRQQDNISEHSMQIDENVAVAFSSSLPVSHQLPTPMFSAFSSPVPDSRQAQPVAHPNPEPTLSTSPEQPEEDSDTIFAFQGSPGKKRTRRLPCLNSTCEKKFMSEHTRQQHMKTHQRKQRPYLPCTMGCNENFSRQHDRFRHEVKKHGFQSEWTCDKCQKFFSSEKSFKSHSCLPTARGKNVKQQGIRFQSE